MLDSFTLLKIEGGTAGLSLPPTFRIGIFLGKWREHTPIFPVTFSRWMMFGSRRNHSRHSSLSEGNEYTEVFSPDSANFLLSYFEEQPKTEHLRPIVNIHCINCTALASRDLDEKENQTLLDLV